MPWRDADAALVEVARPPDLALAAILRGRLAVEGIEALLFDEGMAGLYGGALPVLRLMVPSHSADAALELLENWARD